MEQKKYKEAIPNLLKSYDLNKSFKEAFFFTSVCYDLIEEYDKAVKYMLDFYELDAKLYYESYLRHEKYGPIMGRILQNYWRSHDKTDQYAKGIFVSLVDSKSKAIYILSKQKDYNFSNFILSRLYLLMGNEDKSKIYFYQYIKNPKTTKEKLFLDSSFNSVKDKEWFLKKIDTLKK